MLTTALCAPYSINHFSNWMLFHTSRWLTHSLCLVRVSPLPTPTSTRVPAACSAASASNNVIKPPHSLWPPPMPCCALTLFFFFSSPRDGNSSVSSQPQSRHKSKTNPLIHCVLNESIVTKRRRISLCTEMELKFRGGRVYDMSYI